ncbi:hypothetical protein BH09SUM1_BH09SUM1_29160 [soil metagenome]
MKQTVVVLLLLVALIGGATIYGLGRHRSGVSESETSSRILLSHKFAEANEAAKGLQILDDLTARGGVLGEDGELLRAELVDQTGDHALALAAANQFQKSRPNSTRIVDAQAIALNAEIALVGSPTPELREKADAFLKENPDHRIAPVLQAALAKQELASGDTAAAQTRLAKVMAAPGGSEQVGGIAEEIGRKNLESLFSSGAQPKDTVYTIASGDSINRIAAKNHVTEELLFHCNNITDARSLQIGQKIRIPSVDFSLGVDIAANTLTLKNHGEVFKIYTVRTGREKDATPVGEFKVLNKKRAPTWRPGNGHTYGPGDPNNELGTRWMSFSGDILGIHGTLHPDTLGEYASNGCVGMASADVEELFDLITVGTPLTITGEQDLARHKIIPAPSIPPPRQVASN